MIDPQDLRQRPDAYKDAVKKKRLKVSVDEWLKTDEARRDLLKLVEDMRAEKNSVSKRVPGMKGTEKETAVRDMKALSEKLKRHEGDLTATEVAWQSLLDRMPGIPLPQVPVGKDDTENREIRKWGKLPQFAFEPKDHVALGEELDIIDISRGVKIAGARTYFLKGDGVRLELAVLLFTLDTLMKKGYTPLLPPLLVHHAAMYGTSYFPGGEEQAYKIEEDKLFLIGTSEVSVTSYHMDETLKSADLPKRYCGISPCFRREAGTYGKDTKGLYRIHQFKKVEQVILCNNDPAESAKMHAEILGNAEEVIQALELPYRVVDVCTGDMGQGQIYKNDIETWMPSRKGYGETHSCSTFHDFQSRRLNMKYEDANGSKQFVHTLNNTCIASPRILIPILECYQRADGSVAIPKVLQPYMGGQEVIARR